MRSRPHSHLVRELYSFRPRQVLVRQHLAVGRRALLPVNGVITRRQCCRQVIGRTSSPVIYAHQLVVISTDTETF